MRQHPQSHDVFRFGVFELDPRAGELRKSGVRLRLQEQPLQVLLMLLERPGDVVTREELRERLWPDGTFVDFEKGVNTTIQKLREVLDDSATTPRFVETVPRRGYRFIYPVEGPGSPPVAQAEGASVLHPPAGAPRYRNWLPLAVAALLIIVVAAIATWMMGDSGTRSDTPVRKFSLAFDGLQPGAAHFARGQAHCVRDRRLARDEVVGSRSRQLGKPGFGRHGRSRGCGLVAGRQLAGFSYANGSQESSHAGWNRDAALRGCRGRLL